MAGCYRTISHDDDLSAGSVRGSEEDILGALRGDGEGRRTDIGFACLHGGDDGIEIHILYIQRHSKLISNSLHQIDVYTYDDAIVIIFVRRIGGIGSHREGAVGAGHILALISHGQMLMHMSVADTVEQSRVAQITDGGIHLGLQISIATGYAEGILLPAELLRQDAQIAVPKDECLGRLFILYHTVYLALSECLDGICRLGVALYAGTLPALEGGGAGITRSAQLHTDYCTHDILATIHRMMMLGMQQQHDDDNDGYRH